MNISNRDIGDDRPVFIIAELSANHNQQLDIAFKTLEAAKKSGADAIKLQTYRADTITIDCDNDYFRIRQGTLWDGKTFYQLYQEAYTPWEWHPKLMELAESLGLICFSSPFDRTAVDFLEEMNVPAYKIASFEITDIPLIEYVAARGKPVIISTGIAMLSDIEEAVNACKRMGNDQIALLKCTSAYPAPMEEMNLRAIPSIAERFKVIAGLSDHSLGMAVPVAAVAIGAKIIEKHFILDRKLGGPDAPFSLEPEEFTAMTKSIRETEKALGKASFELSESSKKAREFSRSLFVVKDMKKGELFTPDNVRSIRPGYGLHTRHLVEVMGKIAGRDIKRGTPLDWGLVS